MTHQTTICSCSRVFDQQPLLKPLDHGEAESTIAGDVQAPFPLVHHVDQIVQRDERLARARRRADVKILIVPHERQFLGLVRGEFVELENYLLIRFRKLASVGTNADAELVHEIAVKVT